MLPFLVFISFIWSFGVSMAATATSTCVGSSNDPACHPEWDYAISRCSTGTYNPQTNTCSAVINNNLQPISVCSPTNTDGACRPERVNPYAATQAAQKAQENIRSRGYQDASCVVEPLGFPGTDTNTGLNYYLNVNCTINGQSGYGGEYFANAATSSWVWGTVYTGSGDSNFYSTGGGGNTSAIGGGTTTTGRSTTGGGVNSSAGQSAVYQALADAQRKVLELQAALYRKLSTNNAVYSGGATTVSGGSTTNTTGAVGGGTTTTGSGVGTGGGTSSGSGTGTGTVSSGGGSTTNSVAPSAEISIINASGTLTFRYMRLDTSEDGWVSWREIEGYDRSGVLVRPVSAGASCTWCNYGAIAGDANPRISSAPSKVHDGDTGSSWNAGETAPNCNWLGGSVGCSGTTRTRRAWIQVDFGAVKEFSKIRAMQNGDTGSEITRVLVSDDGRIFKELTVFRAPMRDAEWMEFPVPIRSGPAEIKFSVMGPGKTIPDASEITIHYGEDVLFSWDIGNADYIFAKETSEVDASLGTRPNTACGSIMNTTLTPFINRISYLDTQPAILPLKGISLVPTEYCHLGKVYKITITAYQRGSAQTYSKTVTIKVRNHENTVADGYYGYNWSFRLMDKVYGRSWANGFFNAPGNKLSPGSSSSTKILVDAGSNSYIAPQLSLVSAAEGMTVTIPQPRIINPAWNEGKPMWEWDVIYKADASAAKGYYPIEFLVQRDGEKQFKNLFIRVE